MSSWIVAIGTAALAIATYIMARKTGAMADATTKSLDASATQFRQERMPVVMPVGEVVDAPGNTQTNRLPWPRVIGEDSHEVRLFIPVENVGAGPALDISASLHFLDQYGSESVSSTQPMETRRGVLPALGPAQRAILASDFRGLAIGPMMAFQLTIQYRDGAGGDYNVTSIFYPHKRSYEKVAFEPPDDLLLPVSKPAPIPLPEGYERVMGPQDEPVGDDLTLAGETETNPVYGGDTGSADE